MRPLCCDQLETLTQGYYPRVDSPVINAAPRRRESYLGKISIPKLTSLLTCLARNDGRAEWSVVP